MWYYIGNFWCALSALCLKLNKDELAKKCWAKADDAYNKCFREKRK